MPDDKPPENHEPGTADETGEGDQVAGFETAGGETRSAKASFDPTELQTAVRTLDARVRWKWCLKWVLVAGVLGAVAGAISVFALEWGALPGVGIFLLALLIGVGHALILYRTWEYEVREDALYLERGVITHTKTVVPFVRVQHIDTNRDPFDRVVGLSSLVVYTAGSRGADVTIPGLRPDQAADLQDRLKVLAKDHSGDDAV